MIFTILKYDCMLCDIFKMNNSLFFRSENNNTSIHHRAKSASDLSAF